MLNPVQTDFACQGCGQVCADLAGLHAHIKEHKLSAEKYYLKYYPRQDLFTKDPLKFKSRESYFANDFVNRTNLKKWIAARQEISSELVRDYLRQWLVNRKNLKQLTYAPCQIELKTLVAPTMDMFDEIFGDYYELCAELGFKDKYGNLNKNTDILSKSVDLNFKVITDSREQTPLKIGETEVKGLSYGDYATDESISGKVRIERKALGDFLGTMSKGLERFEREIQRAAADNFNLVVMVEDKFSSYLSFPYLPHIRSKATVDYISHNIRYLINKYHNVQFLFCNGRAEAARLVKRILGTKDISYKIDLQLAYDKGLL